MPTAFISHASEDHEVAERICDFLEQRNIRCWVAPRDVRPGHRYGEEIVTAIQEANAVILILSESANNSKFVEREIERAVSYGKPTLPVRVREVQPSRSLELFISDAHWIDAWKPPMEQYLDRLADSIRSLSPDEGEAREKLPTPRRAAPLPKRSSSGKWLIVALPLVLCVAGGGVAVWYFNRSSAPPPTPAPPAINPPPVASPTLATPIPSATFIPPPSPAPPAETPTPAASLPSTLSPTAAMTSAPPENESVTPTVQVQPSVAEVLAILGNANGMARYLAIRQNEARLPGQISVDDLLALIDGTSRRSDAIEMLFPRLPAEIPVADVMRILDTTSGMERYGLIRLLSQRLRGALSVDQLLALTSNTSRRSDAISLLFPRLPNPLTIAEVLRILGSTSGLERYGLIRFCAERLPSEISVNQLLTLINNTSRRNDTIQLLFPHLPNPLPVAEVLQILGPTSGMERYGLIQLLSQRLPGEISVDQLLTLINNASRRNDAIELLARRLAGELSYQEMEQLLGTTSGMERYSLIRILSSRAPAHLSREELSALTQGSSRPEEAEKMLRQP